MARIVGTQATDNLYGTVRADTISAGSGDDYAIGEAGRDLLRGGGGDDSLEGGNGNDRLIGGGGFDFLIGGAGDDLLSGGTTAPNGWNDSDAVSYYFEGGDNGVTVNLATGKATDTFGNTDTLVDIERVIGSEFADKLTGGNAANDRSERFRGLDGNDTINGGSGFDLADYAFDRFEDGFDGVVVDLGRGTARDGFGNTDRLTAIEGIRATDYSDALSGDGLDNYFIPLGGNDVINGRGGQDRVSYESDVFLEEDSSNGTRGIDADLATGIVVDTAEYIDVLQRIENIDGSYLDDVIRGNASDNVLYGSDGDDILSGRGGGDLLDGGFGQDRLKGGTGDDTFYGFEGDDVMRGGAGSDYFVILRQDDDDVIADFTRGQDTLDVSDFNFASVSAVLALVKSIGSNAVLLQLSADVSIELHAAVPSGSIIAAGDIVI